MVKSYGKINITENRIIYIKNEDIHNGFPLIIELFKKSIILDKNVFPTYLYYRYNKRGK